MKNALALLVLLALVAVPAFAEDGAVPRATLVSLGLGDLQRISDAQGMQVRGQASFFSRVRGTTVIFGQLYEPATTTYHTFSATSTFAGQSTTTGTLSRTHTIVIAPGTWITPTSIRSIRGTVTGIATITITHP